ncbi:MAG: PH domain-containing protein [Chloroflexaceae bacterium]|nr:PH domain-containing protein [Chloroflexaceae bacterium]
MPIEQQRAAVIARIWQAIAQSKVDISVLPQDQLEQLVSTIADNVLLSMNEMLDDINQQTTASQRPSSVVAAPADSGAEAESSPTDADDESEQVLWEGRPFLSISEKYTITNERVRINRGMFGKEYDDIELIRLKDIDLAQSLGERMINVGDIKLYSADASEPEAVLQGVSNPTEVHEILRRAMLQARKRYGLRYREDM